MESVSRDSLNPSPAAEIEYRAVEPLAVAGVLLGSLAAVALLGGVLWLVPATAVLVNVVALLRIKRDAQRIGRAAALVGLGLAVLFIVAPGAQWATSFVMLSRQARPVAEQWFEFLREEQPEKALMLNYAPEQRPPLDEGLWFFYRHDEESKYQLRKFVKDPLVRVLLALGDRATVRFDRTRSVVYEGAVGGVQLIYTVTYPDGDGKKTFFVSVLLERKSTARTEVNPWRVKAAVGGLDPNKPLIAS